MLDKRWTILLAVLLIVLSILLYLLHFAIFQDPHHIWIYLLGDLAFLPVEVLLVTLILHQLLEARDRKSKLEKMNMLIGTFFSTMGTQLLTYFSDNDPKMPELKGNLVISESWSDQDFARVSTILDNYSCELTTKNIDFSGLKAFLIGKEDFLVRLLENPLLLEHESFSRLLQAVFHLTDELQHRKTVSDLSENDRTHLAGDICRAYNLLITEWLSYMHYLKNNYPYLYSLALRTNPFDEQASPMIP
jgi:hypothetical protein